MIYKEVQANLFDIDKKYVLVQCISQDCVMGKGIATIFNEKFKGMKEKCKRVIDENNLSFPCVIPYQDNNGAVFNLVTKKLYSHKPKYSAIKTCIKIMATVCKRNNIRYLAMPMIGCGIDGLSWDIVRNMIQEEFNKIDITIEIRYTHKTDY